MGIRFVVHKGSPEVMMSPDLIFLVCNYGVLPAWLLLFLAPAWQGTQRMVHRIWIPVMLGLFYLWAMLANPGTPAGGSFSTLGGVMRLFTSPYVALAGWIHYLAFDLFIGAWQVRDAQRRGIRHAWLVPSLVLTLMAGPLGLLFYLVVRFLLVRDLSLEESTA